MSLYDSLGGQLRGDQIRLLTLSQAPDGDNVEPQIRCDLEVARLGNIESTPPEYFALSYTWGRPAEYGNFKDMTDEKKFPILCNGEYTIWVTENLLAFFRQIQQKTSLKSKRFWIDAICINQDNNDEKAAQISLMTRIYSGAKTVLLWLGEDDEYTASGFGLIGELSSHRILPETANVNESLAVGMVFQRTYFSRTWVIQEVILGTDDSGEVMVTSIGRFSSMHHTTSPRPAGCALWTDSSPRTTLPVSLLHCGGPPTAFPRFSGPSAPIAAVAPAPGPGHCFTRLYARETSERRSWKTRSTLFSA